MFSSTLPLVGFTILMQVSAGGTALYYLTSFLPLYRNKSRLPLGHKFIPLIFLALAILGVLISLLHLGHPGKALNTLENLKSSWLSREILMTILYLGFSGIFTMILFIKPEWKRACHLFIILSIISGIALIYTMSGVYSAMPVPAWHALFTFLNFFAASITMGGAVLLLLQIPNGSWSGQRSLAWIIGIVMILEIMFIPVFLSYLDNNSQASQLSLKLLLEDNNLVFYFRLGLQLAALGLISLAVINIKSFTDQGNKLLWPVIGTTICIIFSEILGRALFYLIEVPLGSL